jgi:hypothetical protein
MENASHAFLEAVRKSMRQVRMAVGTATVNPKLLTAAERMQYEGYLRRERHTRFTLIRIYEELPGLVCHRINS